MKKGDVIVIFVVVLLSIASITLISMSESPLDKKNVIIEVNGKVVKAISVTKETEGIYDFNFSNNVGYLDIQEGKVRMLKMDQDVCPQQICSDTGWIEFSYETIVCLPNKISVNIQGIESNESEIDGVSF